MENGAKKVMIVDDEEDVITYLSALLSDNGYTVFSATNGRKGLELMREVKPDLVCLDILMPGETGHSLYRKIRSDPELFRIPVIIISGMNYRKALEGEEGPAGPLPPPEDYIEKPVRPDQLLRTVEAVIG